MISSASDWKDDSVSTVLLRRRVVAGELPSGWLQSQAIPSDVMVTVTIEVEGWPSRRLLSFIGAGAGLFTSAEDVDRHLEDERRAWAG